MRGQLAGRCYQWGEYTGVVGRCDRMRRYVCVTNIRDSAGKQVTDHVWFTIRPFRRIEARRGDVVRFYARVVPYVKHGGDDYKLHYPRNLKVLPRSK